MATKAVVIVAGGSGSRMGAALPKQFLELRGEPILVRTIKRFFEFDPSIELILVLPKGDLDRWKSLEEKYFKSKNIISCIGGKTRFHSVKNGLEKVKNASIIGIHDAVRPLVSKRTLEFCYSAAEEHEAVVPVYPMKSSLRKIQGITSLAIDRTKVVAVQTPQCFPKKTLDKAFEQSFNEQFTDDATVAEFSGFSVHCVDGNEENIKITTPYDLLIAELLVDSGF